MAIRKATAAAGATVGAAVARAAATAGKFVKVGRLDTYVSGGGLPEGDYCLMFKFKLHQPMDRKTNQARGEKRLGVMITAYDLNNIAAEPKEEFYSMGSKAHLSYCPDPETGMKIMAIPGAPAASFYQDTKWQMFLEELYNSTLPDGVFEDDLTAINGIHVHLHPIPEPASWSEIRKGAQVSEAAMAGQQVNSKPQMVAVPTMILDGGKPWEGTGGIPKEAKTAHGANGKAVAAAAASAPKPEDGAGGDDPSDDELLDLGSQAVTAILATPGNADGMPKAKLKTDCFEWATREYEPDVVTAMMDLLFGNADNLSAVLGELGYKAGRFKIERA